MSVNTIVTVPDGCATAVTRRLSSALDDIRNVEAVKGRRRRRHCGSVWRRPRSRRDALREVQELAEESPSLRCVDPVVDVHRIALAIATVGHGNDQLTLPQRAAGEPESPKHSPEPLPIPFGFWLKRREPLGQPGDDERAGSTLPVVREVAAFAR